MYVASHVDSIKFSGDFIAGLSLSSSRTLKLTYMPDTETEPNTNTPKLYNYATTMRFSVPPRSLYILHGPLRYNYGHAISGVSLPIESETADDWIDGSSDTSKSIPEYERRISVMFRNVKE